MFTFAADFKISLQFAWGGGKQILLFFLTKRPIIAVAESVHIDAFK